MTIKDLKEDVEKWIADIRSDFNRFYSNEFLHLRKRQDTMFWFLLTTAITAIGTLITAILLLLRG